MRPRPEREEAVVDRLSRRRATRPSWPSASSTSHVVAALARGRRPGRSRRRPGRAARRSPSASPAIEEEVAAGRATRRRRVVERAGSAHVAVADGAALRARLGAFPVEPAAAVLRGGVLPAEVGAVMSRDRSGAARARDATCAAWRTGRERRRAGRRSPRPAPRRRLVRALRPQARGARAGRSSSNVPSPAVKRGLDVWGDRGGPAPDAHAAREGTPSTRRAASRPGASWAGSEACASSSPRSCSTLRPLRALPRRLSDLRRARATETDSPRGRIHLMRALEEGRLEPTPEVVRHLDLCLGCRACETACPSGVPYGALIEAARPYVEAASRRAAGALRRGGARGGPRRRRARRASRSRRSARSAARAGSRAWRGAAARAARGSRYAAAAAAARRRGVAAGRARARRAGRAGRRCSSTGCVADTLFAAHEPARRRACSSAPACASSSRRNPGCCGALALHLGAADRARALARAACVARSPRRRRLGRDHGGRLRRAPARVRPPAARRRGCAPSVAPRARDALDAARRARAARRRRGRSTATVAVHDPCHLAHGQGVRDAGAPPARRRFRASGSSSSTRPTSAAAAPAPTT